MTDEDGLPATDEDSLPLKASELEGDAKLDYSQNLRMLMVDAITAGGKALPSDAKDVSALAKVLKDYDANEISRRRLDLDNKESDTRKQALAVLEQIRAQREKQGPVELAAPSVPDVELDYEILDSELTPMGEQVDLEGILAKERAKLRGSTEEE